MKRALILMGIALAAPAAAQLGVTSSAPPATVVTKQQLADSVAGGMLSKGNLATRVGNDRISVDVLKRTNLEEGPVVHHKVTEIYQVIDGGGDLETGGMSMATKPMVGKDGKPTNPESIGPSVVGTKEAGGTTRHIGIGDIVMIPPGVPHHFTKLDGSITYAVTRINPGYYGK